MKKEFASIILLLYVWAIPFKAQTENKNIDTSGKASISDNLLTIKSNDIDDTSIGSVNNSYSFYAESFYPVTNYSWTYKAKKKDNSFETIATSSSPNFSINPLTLNDDYYITEYGDISGKIILQATVNGESVSAEFYFWLETSPSNIVYGVKIIKESSWYYNLEVTAYSTGATKLTITLTDYSIGESLENIFYNHQYVEYKFGPLYYDFPILIEFSSQNNYGSKYNSYYTDGINYNAPMSLNSIENNNQIDKREVYTGMGRLELILDMNENLHTSNLKPGIYIVKTIYQDGTFSSKKFIKN